jgi:hypothetical protein
MKEPNQAPEPTPLLVTDRADARSAPSKGVAHLYQNPRKFCFPDKISSGGEL